MYTMKRPTPTDFSVRSILGLKDDQPRVPIPSTEVPKKRQRRSRTVFSDDALDALEYAFTENSYPDVHRRVEIARQIGEEEARVQVWFQNRRARSKRLNERLKKRPAQKSKVQTYRTPVNQGVINDATVKSFYPFMKSDFGDLNALQYFCMLYSRAAVGCDDLQDQVDTESDCDKLSVIPSESSVDSCDLQSLRTPTKTSRTDTTEPSSSLWSPGSSPTYRKLFKNLPCPLSPISDIPDSLRTDVVLEDRLAAHSTVICVPGKYLPSYSPVPEPGYCDRRSGVVQHALSASFDSVCDTDLDDCEDALVIDLDV